MALFSERLGFVKPREVLQIECANEELRMSIYNMVHRILGDYSRGSNAEAICKELWTMEWHNPVDTFPVYSDELYQELRDWVFNGQWYVCYDLIEFVYNELNDLGALEPEPPNFGYGGCGWDVGDPKKDFQKDVNAVLEAEGSGYRFLGERIVPVSNELELASIEQSMSAESGLAGASAHIQHALELLAMRPDPDCLNSVKESISAAESAARRISPIKTGTLADAVESLRKTRGLHKSLAEAWKRMFGYTSDADGIRHGGEGEPVDLDPAFAKYMLVTCSAFVNYLAEEFGRDGQCACRAEE